MTVTPGDGDAPGSSPLSAAGGARPGDLRRRAARRDDGPLVGQQLQANAARSRLPSPAAKCSARFGGLGQRPAVRAAPRKRVRPLLNAVRRAKLGGGGRAMSNAADFARLALTLPGVEDYPHFDRRVFRARVTVTTLAPDGLTANLKFSPDEQMLKCAVAPDAFAPLDNAWGRRGWTRATLAALSEAELAAAMETAWHRASTPKKRAR